MIPLKLEMRNFLAYRDPGPIDFSGLGMACLVGPNGAGKSSVLDAISWSLWGKARAKTDNELVHAGEQEMSVSLTFELDRNQYQVIRERSVKGRGSTNLALRVWNPDKEEWNNITEATIRLTEAKIIRTIHLDYQTFINSAFLAQGRADEFTAKTPAERKAILGEILDLEIWTRYEDRTKEEVKRLEDRSRIIQGALNGINEELNREVEYQRELLQAQDYLGQVREELLIAEAQFREVEGYRREWSTKTAQFDDMNTRMRQAQSQIEGLEHDRQNFEARLADAQAILVETEAIEAGYREYQEALKQQSELGELSLNYTRLREHFVALQGAIEGERIRLESERDNLLKANLSLEATLKQTSESDAVTQAEMEMQELETRRAEMESWKEEASELGKEESGLVSANQLLKAEGDKLNAQLEELSSSSDPICPLCGQDLSDEHRADLIASLETEREERRDLYAANASRIIELDKLVNERQTLINKTAPKLRRLDALRDLVARQSEKRIHEEEKNEELHQNQAVIQEIEGRLEVQDYAAEQREALNQTQAELDNLGYREGDIHEVRDAVERLVAFQDRKASLDAARKSLPDLESNLTRSSEQFAVWQTQLHADEEKYEALTLEVEELTQKVEGYEALQSRMSELSDEQGRAQAAFGAAKQKVNALDSQRERRDELLEEQRSIAEEKGIYEELRRAFGRDGIPAMIIEAAIPEIESEANEILSRMTDGRMHIRFDTQREKVTGGTRETLDITIADELGSRDYATFSGGEAFRVNFAIRLALSRMLARRAGAQLRTLIIDEGFGTQDTQGRERLVQAINAIKDEFDLILVITHIDELKDAFPARIEITKTPQGSVVELV